MCAIGRIGSASTRSRNVIIPHGLFLAKEQAIDYAQSRACFRSGEIRILDSTGKLERTIAFDEADRKL
jgi:hypothetical protein